MTDSPVSNVEARLLALEETVRNLSRAVERLARRAEPFGVYMGDGIVLTQMTNGLRFFVPSGDTVMAPKMIGNRVWEPRVTSLMQRIVRGDKDFLDVGANIGYFSVLVASIIGRGGGEVHAFEPNPYILDILRKNISINWSIAPIHVHPFAIGETDADLQLRVPGKVASNGSLLRRPAQDDTSYSVKVVPLTSMRFEPGRVGLVKIDVEGAEPMVFAGALEFFRQNPDVDIVMEWDKAAQNHHPGGLDNLIAWIKQLDYKLWSIEREVTPLEVSALANLPYMNILLSHRQLEF